MTELSESAEDDPPPSTVVQENELLDRVTQLNSQTKLVLIRELLTQLEPAQIQAVVEFGQQRLKTHLQSKQTSDAPYRETSLILKKDYSYQERGLSEPTQYYVYLRRRKPKLDRYIGALFYVPQGCTLSYIPTVEGCLLFQPPHNLFKLTDARNSAATQVVRLVGLEPPPPDYTFTKQQNDVPAIHLRVEYLDPLTWQMIAEQSLPFPSCMHEGGGLDRYRWDVALCPLEVDHQVPSLTFYLSDRASISQVLERMQCWVTWSEQAIPQSKWAIAHNHQIYTLINAKFKRSILSVSVEPASVTLHGSLAVIVKWFHDLGLAISQAHNQGQTFEHLKLAHNLLIEMSLPQQEPLSLLQKLFGVEFSTVP